jgi:hypothetical protein
MNIRSFLRPRTQRPSQNTTDSAAGLNLSPYVGEYLAAIDRTEAFGFETPSRVLVKKDCLDMRGLRPCCSTSSILVHPIP